MLEGTAGDVWRCMRDARGLVMEQQMYCMELTRVAYCERPDWLLTRSDSIILLLLTWHLGFDL
jgi:hypothetical protein